MRFAAFFQGRKVLSEYGIDLKNVQSKAAVIAVTVCVRQGRETFLDRAYSFARSKNVSL